MYYSLFITPILKSLMVPVIWLALIDAIYSRVAPFFALNRIFFPANEVATLKKKTNWQSSESALALTLSMEKCVESWLKNNNGRNFQFTRFTFIDFVLTDRRSLSDTRLKSASGKSSSCRFSFSAERNANTKATECATFFSLLVFFLF